MSTASKLWIMKHSVWRSEKTYDSENKCLQALGHVITVTTSFLRMFGLASMVAVLMWPFLKFKIWHYLSTSVSAGKVCYKMMILLHLIMSGHLCRPHLTELLPHHVNKIVVVTGYSPLKFHKIKIYLIKFDLTC